jgi:hypothetical protein
VTRNEPPTRGRGRKCQASQAHGLAEPFFVRNQRRLGLRLRRDVQVGAEESKAAGVGPPGALDERADRCDGAVRPYDPELDLEPGAGLRGARKRVAQARHVVGVQAGEQIVE